MLIQILKGLNWGSQATIHIYWNLIFKKKTEIFYFIEKNKKLLLA